MEKATVCKTVGRKPRVSSILTLDSKSDNLRDMDDPFSDFRILSGIDSYLPRLEMKLGVAGRGYAHEPERPAQLDAVAAGHAAMNASERAHSKNTRAAHKEAGSMHAHAAKIHREAADVAADAGHKDLANYHNISAEHHDAFAQKHHNAIGSARG